MRHADSETGTVDEVFDALCEERRRTVLEIAADRSTPLDLDALAAAVAERESTAETDRKLRTALHHVHLPKLDERGLLDYDAASRTVEPTPSSADVERSLELAEIVLSDLRPGSDDDSLR